MNIINNSAISIGSKLFEAVTSIISAIFLARLIDPSDFGTFSIVIATYGLFIGFLDVGLTPSYVNTKVVTQQLNNSFFTINICLGILSSILLVISAPIISSIYGDFKLLYLMLVFSTSVIISSIGLQGIAQLTREKKFFSLMKINTITALLSATISISVAFLGAGIWTFNIAIISKVIISTVLVFYFNENNKYRFSNYSTLKLYSKDIRFGTKIFLGRILNGIFNSADKLLLGNSIDSNTLGQYKNSQLYAKMSDTHLRMPIGNVIYSYIARYSDLGKKSSYFKFAILTSIITLMANGLLFLKGEEIYLFVFGSKWELASILIRYFSFLSMGFVLKGIYTTISIAEDKMNHQNILTAISILILGVNALIYFAFDISILSFVKSFSFSIFLFWSVLLCKLLYSFNKNKQFQIYFLISILIVVICEIIKHLVRFESPIINFIFISVLFESLMVILFLFYINITFKKKKV